MVITDSEDSRISEIEEKLRERKARKVRLSDYAPHIVSAVRSALVQGRSLDRICKLYAVPAALVLHLQRTYNKRFRRKHFLSGRDKIFYVTQMQSEGKTDEQIAEFLDLSLNGYRQWWRRFREYPVPTSPSPEKPSHYSQFSYH